VPYILRDRNSGYRQSTDILSHLFSSSSNPAWEAAAIIIVILTCNERLFTLFKHDRNGDAVATTEFVGQYSISWNELSACIVITLAPVVLFLPVTQQYIR
jgi:ABC-type glycerol-3-phosphate transport system permease component